MTLTPSKMIAQALICAQMCSLAYSADLPRSQAKYPVGILRVGDLRSPLEEKAYPLVEKRVQRWLENFPGFSSQVRPLALSLHGEGEILEVEQTRLRALSQSLASHSGEGSAEILAEVQRLRAKLRSNPKSLPSVQQSLLAEASYLWSHGKIDEASPLMREALLLHPDIAAESHEAWDSNEEPTAFDGQLVRMSGQFKRICGVEVKAFPSEAIVATNGFGMGTRKEFQLVVGQTYHFSISAPGFEPYETRIRCDRSSKRQVVARLNRQEAKSFAHGELSRVSHGNGMASLCLIEARGGEFKLYLFSPGVALEEIPLQKPLRIAEVAAQPVEGSIPVASDAFLTLFEKHRVAQLQYALGAPRPATFEGTSSMEVGPAQWYNDWKFWAIAGGVAAGLAGVFLLTRESEVKTHGGGLTIHWE